MEAAKNEATKTLTSDISFGQTESQNSFLDRVVFYTRKLDTYGFESTGIERVAPEERLPQSWVALCLIWKVF